MLGKAYWDAEGTAPPTRSRVPRRVAADCRLHDSCGQDIPDRRGTQIGKEHRFSSEKLGAVLAIFKYDGFDEALEMVRSIFEVGGKATPAASTRSTTNTSTAWR